MKGPPDRQVRIGHQLHEAFERHGKRKPPAELERGEAQHGTQVPAEALGRGVLQPVGHIRDRKARRLEQIGGMQQPDGGEIVLGRWKPRPGKAGHEGARPDVQSLRPAW